MRNLKSFVCFIHISFINRRIDLDNMVIVKKGKKDEYSTEGTSEQKKKTSQQEIDDLEKEIAKTKYNKRTERAIGLLKAKLARLKYGIY